MNNYQPEDARWADAHARDSSDDLPADSEDLDFLEMTDESARRFDLLSAYLDDEVSVEERRQVQYWLDTDPNFKKLYHQLRGLPIHLQQIPVPTSVPANRLAEKVFQSVDRRRTRRAFLYGGAVLAAMAVALISHGLFGRHNSLFQTANRSLDLKPESDSLMIALNDPIIEIPETVDSSRPPYKR